MKTKLINKLRIVSGFSLAIAHLLISSTAIAGTGPSPRFQRDCERRLPSTSINVVARPSAIEYDFSKNTTSLTALMGKLGSNETTLGLTQSTFSLKSSWEAPFVFSDSSSKLSCLRPIINIELSAGPQRVSIGSEFENGSCAFDEIAAHELRHVTANQDQLEKVADLLKQELSASFGNRVFYGTHEELKQAFSTTMEQDWLPWAKSLYNEVQLTHQNIDSPDEYARNNIMCDGAVPAALRAKQ